MNTVVETITPAKANEYLNTSKGNRSISQQQVRSYADTMKKGAWMMNGVGIIFDIDGCLIDGHHRLNAIMEAQIPVSMMVVRGVDSNAFTTYDCGLHRTLGQLLQMQGVKNANAVGAIVSVNYILKKSGRICANNTTEAAGSVKNVKRTNAFNYDVYSKDTIGYDEAAEFACEMYRNARVIKTSWIGGLYYYLTHTGGYDKEFVSVFFKNLCSISSSDITPIEKLRKRIIDGRLKNLNMTAEMLFALVCKAWNYYVENKKVDRLFFKSENEEYPKLKLNV